jgi:hypothetical protein
MPHVTQAPAPVLPEAQQGLTEGLQASLSAEVGLAAGASTGVTQAQRQALLAYRTAVQEYEARRQIDRRWMPMDRTSALVPLQLRGEATKRRCLGLGINPEALRGG